MDLYEAQDFYKTAFPGKNVLFEFDEKCHRSYDITCTEGLPNPISYIVCRYVKVTVEGISPQYIPIDPHRIAIGWAGMKNIIDSKTDVYLTSDFKEGLEDLKKKKHKDLDKALDQVSNLTGLHKDKILSKLDA